MKEQTFRKALSEVKVRRTWGPLSPVTRVVHSRKAYNRARAKEDFRKLV